jgi:hypothetical protein
MKDDRTIGRMFSNDIRLEYADCALELPQVLLTVGLEAENTPWAEAEMFQLFCKKKTLAHALMRMRVA